MAVNFFVILNAAKDFIRPAKRNMQSELGIGVN